MPETLHLSYDEKAIMAEDKKELAKYIRTLIEELKKALDMKVDKEADAVVTGSHRHTSTLQVDGDPTAGDHVGNRDYNDARYAAI